MASFMLAGEDGVMGAQRKSYSPAYRREAAHLVIDTGRMIAEVAREIGVGEQLLGKWVAIERSRMADPPPAVDADERAELQGLRREVAELRMDREFPKKAATYGVSRCVQLLGVSRSGFYAWRARHGSESGPRAARRAVLSEKIVAFHDASDGSTVPRGSWPIYGPTARWCRRRRWQS